MQTQKTSKECSKCAFFKSSFYSKSEKNPDSRCTHNSAVLAKDEKGEVISFMLVTEARNQLADETKHGIAPWGYIPCGPKAMYFKDKV